MKRCGYEVSPKKTVAWNTGCASVAIYFRWCEMCTWLWNFDLGISDRVTDLSELNFYLQGLYPHILLQLSSCTVETLQTLSLWKCLQVILDLLIGLFWQSNGSSGFWTSIQKAWFGDTFLKKKFKSIRTDNFYNPYIFFCEAGHLILKVLFDWVMSHLG